MAHDLTSKFYTCLNLPVYQKLTELTKIIDQSSPNKELQALFPQLISHIFASTHTSGWGLRNSYESQRYDYDHLLQFLEPQGPMLRLCYKLLSDPQLKYELPLKVLPLDLQMTLEVPHCCPQFYSDMLATDPQTMNVSALMLNSFDYYMFNFALHLVNNDQNKNTWENKNTVYFALACDYLLHFLPVDPNIPVLPHIPNYTGKMTMAAPLQAANRPYSPSLLLMSDISSAIVTNQHPQSQARNEVWRSETVLQVFVDIWMSVDQFNNITIDTFQTMPTQCLSPERVRTVRVLIKHLHSFSAKHLCGTGTRSSALRKYARQLSSSKGYHYVKHLVTTWPLDASFRLVLELWLSLIQPWRYVNNCISREVMSNNNQEDNSLNTLDSSFIQFIAENFPSYTCIFQLVLPRFMRLDLTSSKNAIMLFRLGKVFSQPHLVPILKNLEQAITDSGSVTQHSPDNSLNNSGYDQNYHNYSYNGVALHKWVAVAKQAISELNLSTNYEYKPIWCDDVQQPAIEFIKKIIFAKTVAEKKVEENINKINSQRKGIWAGIMEWLMLDVNEENTVLEESRKVPTYLNSAVHYFCSIFMINDMSLIPDEPAIDDTIENSSFGNSTNIAMSITNKLRKTPSTVNYMGDPDLMPITSYESTILVRMLYQISSKINELYEQQFINLWNRNDFWGFVAKEVLQEPCRIQIYVKDMANYQNIVRQELPARLSLRKLGSHSFVVWFVIGYLIFKALSYSGFSYVFLLVSIWMLYVLIRASLKTVKLI